jgi:hypothetical protein
MWRVWYVLGAAVSLVCCVLAYGQCTSVADHIEAMPRMVSPGSQTFELAADEHYVFGEDTSIVGGKRFVNSIYSFETRCTLVDKANRTIEMTEVSRGYSRYSLPSYRGKSLYRFTVSTRGRYTLRCEDDGTGKAVIAVGQGAGQRNVLALILLLVVGGCSPFFTFPYAQARRRKAIRREMGLQNP